MEAPETQGKRTVFIILVSSCVFFRADKVIRLVRFQGRQGGFMSSKAQISKKDYERGLRIADRRKEMGLLQDELAHRVGIGRQALSAIENGGDFKVSVLRKIAVVLNCSTDELLYGVFSSINEEMQDNIMNELKRMSKDEIKKWLYMLRAVNDIS